MSQNQNVTQMLDALKYAMVIIAESSHPDNEERTKAYGEIQEAIKVGERLAAFGELKHYDMLTPDGFSINPAKVYSSPDEAVEEYNEWVKRYYKQGYYSHEMKLIPLAELHMHMQIVQVRLAPQDPITGEQFMNAFNDVEWLNENLSVDDRIEVFKTILLGGHDITKELLDSVLSDYSVSNLVILDTDEPIQYYAITSEERGQLATIREGDDFEERLKTALEQNYDAVIESFQEIGAENFCKAYEVYYHDPATMEEGQTTSDQITLTPVSIY